jgi:hypothetical protein
MKIILFCLVAMANLVHAQGCIVGNTASQPRYICFDGRTLEMTPRGYLWNGKRGCFLSSVPCCNYNATHYAFYNDPRKIGKAYARCRHDYPFRLGEMQTH